MDKLNRYEPGLPRSTLYRAMVGAIAGGVISGVFANTALGYFNKFAPWVGPAAMVGLVGLVMLGILLLPLIFKPRTNKDR